MSNNTPNPTTTGDAEHYQQQIDEPIDPKSNMDRGEGDNGVGGGTIDPDDPLLIAQTLTYVTDNGSVVMSFSSAPFSFGE